MEKIKKLIMKFETNTGFMTIDKTDSELLITVLSDYVKIKENGIR